MITGVPYPTKRRSKIAIAGLLVGPVIIFILAIFSAAVALLLSASWVVGL